MYRKYFVFLLIFQYTKADNQNFYFQSNLNIFIELLDIPAECSEILKSFAENASNFTLCSILHARPIRVCERCVDNYVLFHEKYQELLQTNVNGTSCGSLFMSQDRLNVIQLQHDNIMAVWDRGHCQSCFNWKDNKPISKNNTVTFYKKFNDTMKCIYNNSHDSEVCEKCMESYMQLDDYYKSLSVDTIGVTSVCMDIVDSMNNTRSIWSKTLNCCNLRKTPEILFLCSAGIISFLPLLFYLVVRYYGPIKDLPNVLKQSRFKQSILRTIESRSD